MLAERMKSIGGSPTSALIARVVELRREGRDIISLNVGEPDFGTPSHIKVAGIRAIVEDFTKYTPGPGILELRKAVADKLLTENGVSYSADEICATVGAKQAIYNALMALCGPGDEVLLPIPCWVSYTEMVLLAGAEPVFVPVRNDVGYALDLDAIERAVTPRTKAIVICTPNNPTGAVYSESDLRRLAEIAKAHDFYIISDEIYEKLIYDGERHISVASLSEDARDRTVLVNGVSKAFAMTGWRLGYVAANREIIGAVKSIQSQTTSATSAIAQKAAVAALTGTMFEVEAMVLAFDERRRYVMERLNGIPGISCAMPKGAFYVLPDVSAYFGTSNGGARVENARDLASYLLEEANVALVPGEMFNIEGRVRISYSNSMENLDRALTRIGESLIKLK